MHGMETLPARTLSLDKFEELFFWFLLKIKISSQSITPPGNVVKVFQQPEAHNGIYTLAAPKNLIRRYFIFCPAKHERFKQLSTWLTTGNQENVQLCP